MLITEMLEAQEQFTSTEQALAAYILDNREKALRETLQQLSDAAFVSKPTVIRLYRKLGFESYTDFQIAFYSELARQSSRPSTFIDYDYPFDKQEDFRQVSEKLAELTRRSINGVLNRLDERSTMAAAQFIRDAKDTFIYAVGDSYIQSLAFRNKLVKIGRYIHLIQEMGEDKIHPFNAKAGDCVLVVTFSGNIIRNHAPEIAAVKKKGVKLVAVTSSTDAKLIEPFDAVLQLEKGEDQYLKLATFHSQAAISFALNTLFACIFGLDFEKNVALSREYYEFLLENGLL